MKRIYMDYNATTPLLPEVLEAMKPYFSGQFSNPASAYQSAQGVRAAVEQARETMKTLLNASSTDEIYFTSCGTESNNIVIKGVAFENWNKKGKLITTQVEHKAVLEPFEWLKRYGFETVFLPVDRYGFVDPDDLRKAIDKDTLLVSVMWANNEVGTIQPIEEIAKICKEADVLFHTDAVQVGGKIKIDLQKIPIDFLSLSAHKFYGPKGVGVLYAKKGRRFQALIHGGSHERNKRAGTLNAPGIIGCAKAFEITNSELEIENKRLWELSERLINGVLEKIPIAVFDGHREKRLPNTVHFSFRGVEGESILLSLDLKGVEISSGSACSSASLELSHVLKAMQLDPITAQGATRFSLGRYNTMEDVEYVLEVLPPIVERLKSFSVL